MIYVDPDDPEAGYFDSVDGSVRCDPTIGYFTDDDEPVRFLVPADCAICLGPIPSDATVPLCTPCRQTAEVAGQQMADAKRFPDPEHRR